MHLAEDWSISYTTTVLCMLITSAAAQEAWFSEKGVVLRTIESKRTTAKSVEHCAFRLVSEIYAEFLNDTDIKRENSKPCLGSPALCRFKFKDILILIQMMQTLHTSANILHVCTHNDVLIIL